MLMKTSSEHKMRRRGTVCALATLFFLPGFACGEADDGGAEDSADGALDSSTSSSASASTAADDSSSSSTGADDTSGTDTSGTDASGTDASGTDTSGTDTSGTDTTGNSGNCGEYPAGPYNWYDNSVVPPDTMLPAKYGPDGAETVLSMADVHAMCEEVKSLVFVFGAND